MSGVGLAALSLVAFVALAWTALIVAALLLPGSIAGPVYLFGSFICHQIADRSFHVGQSQLPVCARCLGIYAGVAAGALMHVGGATIRGRGTSDRIALVAAAMPTMLTVALEWAGLWSPANITRAVAGALLGAVVAFVTMRAIHYEQCQRRRSSVPIQRSTPI